MEKKSLTKSDYKTYPFSDSTSKTYCTFHAPDIVFQYKYFFVVYTLLETWDETASLLFICNLLCRILTVQENAIVFVAYQMEDI